MEFLPEILIVVGVMVPSGAMALGSLRHGHIVAAIVEAAFSVGLGLIATGILMIRRQKR